MGQNARKFKPLIQSSETLPVKLTKTHTTLVLLKNNILVGKKKKKNNNSLFGYTFLKLFSSPKNKN